MNTMVQPGISYNLYYVEPNSVDLWWIDQTEAINHTPMTDEILKDLAKKGNVDLFLAKDTNLETYGALVLRVFDSFDGKVMEIIAATGREMNKWFSELWQQVEEIAKKCQCKRIIISGRPGWERQMKVFDFKKSAIILEKTL